MSSLPMTCSFQSVSLVLTLFAGLGAWQAAAVEPLNSPPDGLSLHLTAQEVVMNMVQRNLERARALGGYQGTRVYRLEYRGFPGNRSAEMIVDLKYRAPGTKEFSVRSEKGSKLLVERVFQRMLQTEKEALTAENQSRVALNQHNYQFTAAGYENLPTGQSYILAVEPLTDNKLLYRGRIWVDAKDFAVVRIEAAPARNPSFWTKETTIEQTYTKVGAFWLPLSNRSTSTIRLGGRASLTIDYHDYQITTATSVSEPPRVAGY